VRHATLGYLAAGVISLALLATPLAAFAATTSVSIKDFAFQPSATVIHAGDTVTWTNLDGAAHTATSIGEFDTGSMPLGASRSVTFATAGTYLYYCQFHSIMFGTVVVVPAGEPLPAVAPTIAPALLRGPDARTLITVGTDTAPTLAPHVAVPPPPDAFGPSLLAVAVFIAGVAALAWRLGLVSRVR
jgi:plastocyanin